MNTTTDTTYLEDLLSAECRCESFHRYTEKCSGEVAYAIINCRTTRKVCAETIDDPPHRYTGPNGAEWVPPSRFRVLDNPTDLTSKGENMDKFTASSGLEMTTHRKGAYLWEGGEFGSILGSFTLEGVQALREFFRAEEDERLGRWRHPEHSQFTVKRNPNGSVYVHNEIAGNSEYIAGRDSTGIYGDNFWGVARDYYDAHPERKPWHDVKPGEVWLLTLNGEPAVPAVVSSSSTGFPVFTAATIEAQGTEEFVTISAQITAGHRIWPQD